MAQWKLELRVIVESHSDTKPVLRAVSRAGQRPMRASYDDADKCVRMTFITDGEQLAEAHTKQCRIVDALYQAIDEVGVAKERYAIEFDTPQVIEPGAKIV